MQKQTRNHVALAEFEFQAQDFISLTLAYCEEELRRSRRLHSYPRQTRETALTAAALSVRDSLKTFLAVVRMDLD